MYTAISGVDSKEYFLFGRPKGEVGIFYKKGLSSKVKPIKSNNRRVCGLVINLATNFTCLLWNKTYDFYPVIVIVASFIIQYNTIQ